jgi:hypothetical protein
MPIAVKGAVEEIALLMIAFSLTESAGLCKCRAALHPPSSFPSPASLSLGLLSPRGGEGRGEGDDQRDPAARARRSRIRCQAETT